MKSPDVDAWFEKYDNPMKPMLLAVRDVILGCDERVSETIKWQAPTFAYEGNIASFYPRSKQHVSLMFHTGAKIPGDFPSMEGTGDTSRIMKFVDLADVSAKTAELRSIVAAWIAMRDQ